MNKKQSRGITLIALIITIVVLLILALVTISAVSDGGIIQKAKHSKLQHEIAQEKEYIRLALGEWKIQKNIPNYEGTFQSFMEQKLDGKFTSLTTEDGNTLLIKMNSGRDYTVTEDGTITLLGNNGGGEVVPPPTTGGGNDEPEVSELGAGLYDENSNLVTSWENLVSNETIILSEDRETIETCTDTSITGTLVISSNITSIGGSAFEDCAGLTSVTIPNRVTSVGEYAFAACEGLTSVTMPGSITSIGECAFGDCPGLTSVTIPGSVTSFGEGVFMGCIGLTSVTIEYGVTSIGDAMFNSCEGLTSVTIPSSVTSICSYAFGGCISLSEVKIPNSVTSIGELAFGDCEGLTATIQGNNVEVGSGAFRYVPTVYYAGYQEGYNYDPWGAISVEPIPSGT